MILVPKNSRFFPTTEQRKQSAARVQNYPPEKFETYNDWFFYIHIDPVQRMIHTFGMYVGLFFFTMIFIDWSYQSIYYYLLGVFFLYGLGVISHLIYDQGQAKSAPRYFLSTLIVVIEFNLATTFGYYDKKLRKFIEKYPFVKEAYELEEIKRRDFFKFLIQN